MIIIGSINGKMYKHVCKQWYAWTI